MHSVVDVRHLLPSHMAMLHDTLELRDNLLLGN